MLKPIIHFSHANGFPAACYQQLFIQLEDVFTIRYIDILGHNPQHPVTNNWPHLVDELIDDLRARYQRPVIGMGHSLGGVLTLLAAYRAPELFSHLILLDPPLYGFIKSTLLRIAKRLNLIHKITPSLQASKRRHYWKNIEEVEKYFRKKPLFKYFTPACLHDYAQWGTEEGIEGRHLRFDPQIESQIFATLPDHVPRTKTKLHQPLALFYGKKSHVLSRYDIAVLRYFYGAMTIASPGTHLFPFEYPIELATAIKTFLISSSFAIHDSTGDLH